jgi:hypothetical protein
MKRAPPLKPVVQEDVTGCAIAAAATLAGVSYRQAKTVATRLGIHVSDEKLWSETNPVRKLLAHYKITSSATTASFRSWKSLPPLALLATKWHVRKGRPFWHWVIFSRKEGKAQVLDSKRGLSRPVRTDLGRIKPKWSLRIGKVRV